jgi:acetyl esterase/lipase
MGMRCWLFSIIVFFNTIMVHAQQELPLYGGGPIPNSRPGVDREKVDTEQSANGGPSVRYSYSLVSRPTLTVFLPAAGKGNGTGVVVCPGGGYTHLAMTHEGVDVARWLNSLGIAAFVLKYRLPSDETMVDKTIGPLQDAQRAIQLVRQRAGEWGVDAGRVGILGFSAGGHLASTAGTHFSQTTIDNSGQISLRPDFMILLYPVISFSDSIGHMGSRENLIGKHPGPALILAYSNERQVTPKTPPVFIIHAEDDKTVPVLNSLDFYEALVKHGVPAELHVYPKGGHGWGLWNSLSKEQWPDECQHWMESSGWITH